MTVHTINGVAKPKEIVKRMGAQIQKRKIAPTPPENFDSICLSLQILFLRHCFGSAASPLIKEALYFHKKSSTVYLSTKLMFWNMLNFKRKNTLPIDSNFVVTLHVNFQISVLAKNINIQYYELLFFSPNILSRQFLKIVPYPPLNPANFDLPLISIICNNPLEKKSIII
jgi:hypothetical protein